MNEVCSPLVSLWRENILYVLLAIKFEITNESGVATTTTRVIQTLIESIKPSVPRMVTIPVKNWVKPIKRPSANWSTSAITRETISPVGWESRYDTGSVSIFVNALSLMSRITLKVILLLHTFMSHCASATTPMIMQT